MTFVNRLMTDAMGRSWPDVAEPATLAGGLASTSCVRSSATSGRGSAEPDRTVLLTCQRGGVVDVLDRDLSASP